MIPKKIIWIVVDTLRADHLGCYGYKRNTSPNMDKLANEGILFNWAFSPSSYTFSVHPSIFTGKYPSNNSFGFDDIPINLNKDNEILLSEILSSNGYETAIFVSNSIMVTDCKIDIGFNFIDKNFGDKTTRRGKETNKEVFKWLKDNQNKDFFLFVHYFDVHGPYIDQKPYDEMFVNDELYKNQQEKLIDKIVKYYQTDGFPDYLLLNTVRDANGNLLNFEKDLRYYKARYDGGIKYCDDLVGDLVNKLKELNLYDDTLIILTADHGESLGELGIFNHGTSVVKEQIHVPLIIKSYKDWKIKPKKIDVQVNLIDIMPSILDLLEYDYSELGLGGESLRELIEVGNSNKLYNRTIISEIELQEAKIDKEYIRITPKNKEFSVKNIRYTVDPDPIVKREFLESFKELWKKEFLFDYREDHECKVNLVVEWTGERFLPWIEGSQIHYEHLHRYVFSSQFVKGKKVLDLACGEGYGSYILSKDAKYVIGVDIDEATVKHARNRYITQNLEFNQGSILEIPIEGKEEFDIIVCFEGIEHIEEHEKFLSEVKRLLKKDGLFIVSSPNKKTYSDDPGFINPFHKKELYFTEFKNLLNKYFEDFIFFGQKIYSGSNIWPLPPYNYSDYKEFIIERQGKEFGFSDVNKKIPQYFIAIASDKKLCQESYISNLIDISNVLIRDLEKQLGMLANDANNKDRNISELTNSLITKESKISELDNSLITKESKISELDNSLITKESKIKTLEDSLQEKSLYIDEIDNMLQTIQQSIVWRSVTFFHINIIEKLLPHDTNRRNMYDLALKSGRIIIDEGLGGIWWHYNERKRVNKLQGELKKNIKEIQKLSIPLENWNKKKIAFPNVPENPDVSIIIPVNNNCKYTFNCLDSILKNTKGSFEVIVVDDASSDDTPVFLKKVENIKIIRNNENQGFIESCNVGAKSSIGKYLFFLNNDTIVTENWWEPLKSLISKDNTGIVGAKLVYPDGKLQEAGGIIWNDASGWNYGRYNDSNRPEYNFVREVDYCSGAALLVKKELFETLGGFDERFKPGYYEDTDLCFSIRKLGYKVLYQPQSTIVHFEGITGGTDINTGAKKYQEINKSKFYTKWKDILEKEHYKPDAADLLFYARDKRKGSNILIIDHYVPTFDKDSGSYRMYNILKILSELGHKVTFIGDNLMPFEPYTDILQQHSIEVIYVPHVKSINDYLTENGRFFDIVILSRSHIAVNHISTVKRCCNKAKIILDTVDLQYLREERRAAIENNENVLQDAQALKKMELKLAKECDVTLVVSPVERDIILKEDPSLKIELLSNIHEIYRPKKCFSERRDIMFLGGFAHLPNIDAVKYFVKDILPIIKKEIPDIKFYVVGSNPPKEIEELDSGDIIVTGYVEDLTSYFENCRALVAPLRYGAGVKGKIGESMAHGLPVMATSIGAEGMNLKNSENVLIADDPQEFANKIIELYKDEDLWVKLSYNSLKHVQENYSVDITKKRFVQIFDEISKKRNEKLPLSVSSEYIMNCFENHTVVDFADFEIASCDKYRKDHQKRYCEIMNFILKNLESPSSTILDIGSFFEYPLIIKIFFPDCEIYINNLLGSENEKVVTIKNKLDVTKEYKFRHNRFNVELDRFPYQDESFDMIICCDVIEHLKIDPMFMLSEINRCLKKGGRLILSTPNISSFYSVRQVLNGFTPKIFGPYGKNRKKDDYSIHIREYTPKEMENCMVCGGFEIIEMATISPWPWWNDEKDVKYILEKVGAFTNNRGELILVAGRKISTVIERYPAFLYY